MQVSPEPDVAAQLHRLVENELPGRGGSNAWSSLLQAHATLTRQLEDLERATGHADDPRPVSPHWSGAER